MHTSDAVVIGAGTTGLTVRTVRGTRLYELLRAARLAHVTTESGDGVADRPDVVQATAVDAGLPAAVRVRPDGYVAWAIDRRPAEAELSAARANLCVENPTADTAFDDLLH